MSTLLESQWRKKYFMNSLFVLINYHLSFIRQGCERSIGWYIGRLVAFIMIDYRVLWAFWWSRQHTICHTLDLYRDVFHQTVNMIQDSEPQKLLSSNADPVRSSAMQKKIRQKYFKNDAVVKGLSCKIAHSSLKLISVI